MNFDFSDEQYLLRAEVQKLFAAHVSYDKLRRLSDSAESADPTLWHKMSELGLLGAAIAQEFGGVGLSELELCVIAEELGRSLAAVPFMSSICVVAEALRLAGSPAQKARWLPALASGATIATFGFTEPNAVSDNALPATVFRAGILTGVKTPVPDATHATLALVTAHGGSDTQLFLVELQQPQVTLSPLPGCDPLRQHSSIAFDGAEAEPLAGGSREMCAKLLDRVATYIAFEQIGGAEACLHMARDYVLSRPMFGRSLASYQAVKHRLADVFLAVELARSNAFYATWAVINGAPELPTAAAAARLSGTHAYEMAARESLQLHGGFGYTWEANCGFHLCRARLLSLNIGASDTWADRLIGEIGSIPSATESAVS